MGWSSGARLAEEVWTEVEPFLDNRVKKRVANNIIKMFERFDADTVRSESEKLYEASQTPESSYLVDDQPITPMPKYCSHWKCRRMKKGLENKGGFMVCPVCECSYGRA